MYMYMCTHVCAKEDGIHQYVKSAGERIGLQTLGFQAAETLGSPLSHQQSVTQVDPASRMASFDNTANGYCDHILSSSCTHVDTFVIITCTLLRMCGGSTYM